jgi:hypothetical protein
MALLCLCLPTFTSACIFNCLHLCLPASVSVCVFVYPRLYLPKSHAFPRRHMPALAICLPKPHACPVPYLPLCQPSPPPMPAHSMPALPMPVCVLCLPTSYACPRPLPACIPSLPASHAYPMPAQACPHLTHINLRRKPICQPKCLPGTVPIWLCSGSINIFYGSGGQLITMNSGSGSYPSIFVVFGSQFGSGSGYAFRKYRY